MPNIITISGKAEHGKDFCAKILQKKLQDRGKKVVIIHYADYLKYVAKQYFEWDGQKNDNGRTLLQWLGTDLARNNYPNIWVNVVIMLVKAIFPNFDYIIIPDCRFPNEVNSLKLESDFIVNTIKVIRLNYENSLTPEQRLHPSETALDNFDFGYTLISESGEGNMTRAVEKYIKEH
jgi:hypothetical protein